MDPKSLFMIKPRKPTSKALLKLSGLGKKIEDFANDRDIIFVRFYRCQNLQNVSVEACQRF